MRTGFFKPTPPRAPLEIHEQYLTRVTLVDETGRVYERWNVEVDIQVEDNGKTLKVFVKPDVSELIKQATP